MAYVRRSIQRTYALRQTRTTAQPAHATPGLRRGGGLRTTPGGNSRRGELERKRLDVRRWFVTILRTARRRAEVCQIISELPTSLRVLPGRRNPGRTHEKTAAMMRKESRGSEPADFVRQPAVVLSLSKEFPAVTSVPAEMRKAARAARFTFETARMTAVAAKCSVAVAVDRDCRHPRSYGRDAAFGAGRTVALNLRRRRRKSQAACRAPGDVCLKATHGVPRPAWLMPP